MHLLVLPVLILIFPCVLSQKFPHFIGNRSAIVHLFEWKWLDIAEECETFLQHKGYAGVQISPPNENVIVRNRPWWERYQPVSYVINTRSGGQEDFKNMTRRCNSVGVRIYADAVINHMTAMNGLGTAGNKADFADEKFPGVPYGPQDFHETCHINNYNDAGNVRNCRLVGLADLDHGKEYVRRKVIEYLNNLIDLGVAGFRIDAAKHMWPEDLNKILTALKDLNTDFGFQPNSKPFIFLEVIDLGNEAVHESEYTKMGAVTEFKYSRSISNVFQGNDKLTWLQNWGSGWGFLGDEKGAIVFVDNHDTQRDEGKLNYKKGKQYKMATAFMLAHPYGIPKVMSSFDFQNRDQGPPHDSNDHLLSPKINPDHTCDNGYICEHRWRQIYNMVVFRNIVKNTPITNWWSNGDQQIAFCRGRKGFVAFTGWGDIERNLATCLPKGNYCDVISGDLIGGKCTGKTVSVGENGDAYISLLGGAYDGVLAIHVGSKVGK